MILQILNTINDIDKGFLFFINRNLSNSIFNEVALLGRESLFWAPLYLFLFLKGFHFFNKKAIIWLLLAVIAVSLTDQISSNFLKNYFMRIRPCNDDSIKPFIHILVNYIPKSYSFTSSHAANHFTLATFLYFTLKPFWGKYCLLFFLWGSFVGFIQIYVGVHYPTDVLGGAVIGLMLGFIFAFVWGKFYLAKPILKTS